MFNFSLDEPSKWKWFYSIVISPVLLFLDPYVILVKAIGILVILDVTTGIMASHKEGQAITSKKAWPKVIQVGLFLFGLAAAREASPLLAEFGIEHHQAGKWFCGLYGCYELFSILENLGRLGLPIAKQFSELLKSKLPEDVQKVTVTPETK